MSDSVAILLDAMKGGSGDIPVPSCLNQCRNSEMFHCKICCEPFTNIHRLISHGADHRSGAVGARVRCAFCGQTFSSPLSLSLHQMVKDNSHDDVTSDLSCPLKCSQEMFSLDNLKSHLVTFHGCDKSTITTHKTRAGHVTVSADTGASDQCPRCGTNIVTGSGVTMERHVMLDCSARSPHVARAVTRVTSNVSDFDPLLILRLEMEAVVTQNRNTLSDNDQKYPFLPRNFSEKYLIVKANNLTSDSETLELFDVWSEYIDGSVGDRDIRDVMNKIEDDLSAQTKLARAVMISRADETTRFAPDAALLSRLEAEMMSGLSPCPRDIEMKITQLGLTL